MQPNPSISHEQSTPEMDVQNFIVDFLVDDEDFNRAINQISEDSQYIISRLASLEDGDSRKEAIEDQLMDKLSQEIPGWSEGADLKSMLAGMKQTADQAMDNNQQLAEVVAQSMQSKKDHFSRIAGNAGIGAGGIFLSSMICATVPYIGIGALGVAGYRTFKMRKDYAMEDSPEIMDAVQSLNTVIEELVSAASRLAVVRDDFAVLWDRYFGEELQEA